VTNDVTGFNQPEIGHSHSVCRFASPTDMSFFTQSGKSLTLGKVVVATPIPVTGH